MNRYCRRQASSARSYTSRAVARSDARLSGAFRVQQWSSSTSIARHAVSNVAHRTFSAGGRSDAVDPNRVRPSRRCLRSVFADLHLLLNGVVLAKSGESGRKVRRLSHQRYGERLEDREVSVEQARPVKGFPRGIAQRFQPANREHTVGRLRSGRQSRQEVRAWPRRRRAAGSYAHTAWKRAR